MPDPMMDFFMRLCSFCKDIPLSRIFLSGDGILEEFFLREKIVPAPKYNRVLDFLSRRLEAYPQAAENGYSGA